MRAGFSKVFVAIFFGVLLTSGFPNFMMQEAHAAADITATAQITGANELTITFSTGGHDINAAPVSAYGTLTIDGDNSRTLSSPNISGTTVTYTISGSALGTDAGQTSGSLAISNAAQITDTNSDTSDGATITITDGQKPTVSVSFDPASGASEDSVTATFTWSESVTGFDVTDLAVSDGSLSGFSGSGSSYSVTWDQTNLESGDYTLTITANVGTDAETPSNTGPASNSVSTYTRGSPSAGGGGCDGDCQEPTLGVLPNGQRIVEDGFTYNGHSVDVERFFTPYPLITAQVGKQNTAVFKIYENRGPDNIAHFDFAFGLGKDQIISDSKAMIEVDFARDGTQTVNIIDPENTLDNVSVTTDIVACNEGPTQCLEITINHMFREPLDFDIVGTNVWDYSRQSWQNYYNHGIEVVGPSLNPAETHDGVNQGHIYHLTETSKMTAVDEFGDSWTFQYGKWMKDYIKQERVQDGDVQVFDRMHSDFTSYKANLSDEAFNQLTQMCPLCVEQYADFDDSTSWEYGNKISKLSNPETKRMMELESQKAQEILKYIMDPKLSSTEKYKALVELEKDDRPISEILAEERMMKDILQAERHWLKQVIAPNQ